jgi:hypothetical protein
LSLRGIFQSCPSTISPSTRIEAGGPIIRADIRNGDPRYLPPDPEEAQKYDERAKQDPAQFTRDVQKILIRTAYDFCHRRKFRLHGAGNELGHAHFAVSWRGYSDADQVMRRLKNILSTTLNKTFNTPGKRGSCEGGVEDV